MVPLVDVGGETVSSSQIRGLVAAGEVREAAKFLGGPFLLEGEVVHGDKRGRELGMPTANIVPDDRLVVPGHGVYAGWAHGHPAAINVGVRPTFETGRGLLVEPYLIDFDGDLYGETLRMASWRSCAARGASSRSTRWWSRCIATSSGRGRSAPPTSPT